MPLETVKLEVICDNPEVKILVSWMNSGNWFVEAHNASDKAVEADLSLSPGWTLFDFGETIELLPGESSIWQIPTGQEYKK